MFLSRPPGSAWASERDERARATSDRSCSAARRLSEFRVTTFIVPPPSFHSADSTIERIIEQRDKG